MIGKTCHHSTGVSFMDIWPPGLLRTGSRAGECGYDEAGALVNETLPMGKLLAGKSEGRGAMKEEADYQDHDEDPCSKVNPEG